MQRTNERFFMPAEYSRHDGCILIWPERPGSWRQNAFFARKAFLSVISAVAESETVYLAASGTAMPSALHAIFGENRSFDEKRGVWYTTANSWRKNVRIFHAETDDAWARDVGPTFVKNQAGKIKAINWSFNAWGGKEDGLYASWEKDDAFACFFARKFGYEIQDASPFVLEGGSVHSDGEGTLLVTEKCLLSRGRNPSLTREQIEAKLKFYLGAEKVLWLPDGIFGDETNEHADNVCAFIRPAEVVLAWTDNKEDPQYEKSLRDLKYLQSVTDAKGRKIRVHLLPVPDRPVTVTEEELKGMTFEEGEDVREAGERLAASYVNFYFSNDAVIFPVFGGENESSDVRAAGILKKLLPERKIIPVYARDILTGGGNIHCITQQIPETEGGIK